MIYKNVIDSAQAVVVAMTQLQLDPVEDINQSYSDKILDYRLDFNQFSGGLNLEIIRSISIDFSANGIWLVVSGLDSRIFVYDLINRPSGPSSSQTSSPQSAVSILTPHMVRVSSTLSYLLLNVVVILQSKGKRE
ncbi:hypothetical protein PSTG_09527 [Puccinia striiformis f. sp. tritici PST-78]|uniref:Uncharacterized protein n=1 Tax=Puccinia striiformis f. sp. tritici PST-78 TaxID=1165861 RepID=A0A0L0VDJ5_9BASI|nr:hypothetical protein PSTG_09527 [Puccinia striiformis f. sp. tritici PST-78]